MGEITDRKVVSSEDPEYQARVDLAAAHRLAVIQGFSEGIFNHFTLAVPGKPDRFLMLSFGLHWSEVTASSLLEVDYAGKVLKGDGDFERSAFAIHAPVHQRNPKAAAVFHTHMPYASALTRLKDQRLLPIGQTEIAMMKHIAYDDHYPGYANDTEEGERIASLLGNKSILFMANHGVIVTGETVAEAYNRLYYLERACQVQLYAMWTNRELREVDPKIVESIVNHDDSNYRFEKPKAARPPNALHFDALKRLLERSEGTEYRN